MQALVTSPPSDARVKIVPIPKPGQKQLLVRVKTIALNPVDALYVAKPNGAGKVVGSDFAGVVEAIGERVDKIRIGERVAGFVHGGLCPVYFFNSSTCPLNLIHSMSRECALSWCFRRVCGYRRRPSVHCTA